MKKTPQQEFDETYISANEICRMLNVTRGAVTSAQQRGLLPPPIKVAQGNGFLYLWLRAQVDQKLYAWSIMLETRKRNLKARHVCHIQHCNGGQCRTETSA